MERIGECFAISFWKFGKNFKKVGKSLEKIGKSLGEIPVSASDYMNFSPRHPLFFPDAASTYLEEYLPLICGAEKQQILMFI